MGADISPDNNTIAIGHGHRANGYHTPSPWDLYTLGNLSASTNGRITTGYIAAAASPATAASPAIAASQYAVVVSNLTAYQNFNAVNGNSYLAKDANGHYSGDFDYNNTNNPITVDLSKVKYNAAGYYLATNAQDPANPTNTELAAADFYSQPIVLAYFVSYYNTGLTLLQADANGVFQPLHYTSQVSSTNKTIYSVSPCN